MKTENKSALLGLIGGAGMALGGNFLLNPPETVENHIVGDTVYVSQTRAEDSTTINQLTLTLNEKDFIIDSIQNIKVKPRIVYLNRKPAAAPDHVESAAGHVTEAIERLRADSTGQ